MIQIRTVYSIRGKMMMREVVRVAVDRRAGRGRGARGGGRMVAKYAGFSVSDQSRSVEQRVSDAHTSAHASRANRRGRKKKS